MTALLAAAADDFDSPLVKYFSFIALGLMMTVGYVVLRVVQGKKERDEKAANVEEQLLAAELEARKSAKDGEGLLALTQEQERMQARIRDMAAQHDLKKALEDGKQEP